MMQRCTFALDYYYTYSTTASSLEGMQERPHHGNGRRTEAGRCVWKTSNIG